jgi:hypothetical protein
MSQVTITDKNINNALFQFIFPFSLKRDKERQLMDQLESEGYTRFDLRNTDLETAYYGPDHQVSHRNMEHYYLPFTANVLFPKSKKDKGFQRYSKNISLRAEFNSKTFNLPFIIHSVDLIICPFQLGLLTIRTEIIKEDLSYDEAIEFAARFRVLEDRTHLDKKSQIIYNQQSFDQVENFIFNALVPNILPFFNKGEVGGSHFETLPYFIDERMYVQGFFSFKEGTEIDNTDVFRAGQLDGLNEEGEPCIGSSSMKYIDEYVERQAYSRWAPDTYYVTDEHIFCCLTNQKKAKVDDLVNQMYGEYYYGLLLNLFHKIVLLKLSNEYSKVKLEKDIDKIEDLIRSITNFSSKYFFLELATQTQGREVFTQLRKLFGSNELYQDVKDTLASLFQYQDKLSSIRNSYLLLILTLYTVVGGIYGMNQVIEDLKGNIEWSKVADYSIFEYIALFITLSGLVVGSILGVTSIVKWFKEKQRQRKEF